MMFRITSTLLFLICSATFAGRGANYVPNKTSNNDLRADIEVFSIKKQIKRFHIVYSLRRSQSGQFSLSYYVKDKLKNRWKIDNESAIKFDDKFIDSFVKVKYMMATAVPNKCSSVFQLTMRGEDYMICAEDESRANEFESFLKEIKKQY